jgi:hypothetical protein
VSFAALQTSLARARTFAAMRRKLSEKPKSTPVSGQRCATRNGKLLDRHEMVVAEVRGDH